MMAKVQKEYKMSAVKFNISQKVRQRKSKTISAIESTSELFHYSGYIRGKKNNKTWKTKILRLAGPLWVTERKFDTRFILKPLYLIRRCNLSLYHRLVVLKRHLLKVTFDSYKIMKFIKVKKRKVYVPFYIYVLADISQVPFFISSISQILGIVKILDSKMSAGDFNSTFCIENRKSREARAVQSRSFIIINISSLLNIELLKSLKKKNIVLVNLRMGASTDPDLFTYNSLTSSSLAGLIYVFLLLFKKKII